MSHQGLVLHDGPKPSQYTIRSKSGHGSALSVSDFLFMVTNAPLVGSRKLQRRFTNRLEYMGLSTPQEVPPLLARASKGSNQEDVTMSGLQVFKRDPSVSREAIPYHHSSTLKEVPPELRRGSLGTTLCRHQWRIRPLRHRQETRPGLTTPGRLQASAIRPKATSSFPRYLIQSSRS